MTKLGRRWASVWKYTMPRFRKSVPHLLTVISSLSSRDRSRKKSQASNRDRVACVRAKPLLRSRLVNAAVMRRTAGLAAQICQTNLPCKLLETLRPTSRPFKSPAIYASRQSQWTTDGGISVCALHVRITHAITICHWRCIPTQWHRGRQETMVIISATTPTI